MPRGVDCEDRTHRPKGYGFRTGGPPTPGGAFAFMDVVVVVGVVGVVGVVVVVVVVVAAVVVAFVWPGSLKVWPGSLKVWPSSLKVWPSSLCVWPGSSYGAISKYGVSSRYGGARAAAPHACSYAWRHSCCWARHKGCWDRL